MGNRINEVKKVQTTLETLLNTATKRIDTFFARIQEFPEKEKKKLLSSLNEQKMGVVQLNDHLRQVNLNTPHTHAINSFFAFKKTANIITSFEKISTILDKINHSINHYKDNSFERQVVQRSLPASLSVWPIAPTTPVRVAIPLMAKNEFMAPNTAISKAFDPLKSTWPAVPSRPIAFDPLNSTWPQVPSRTVNTTIHNSSSMHWSENMERKTSHSTQVYRANANQFRANQEIMARGLAILSNKEEGVTKYYKQQMNHFTHNLDTAESALDRVEGASKAFVGQNSTNDEVSALIDAEFSKQFPRIK